MITHSSQGNSEIALMDQLNKLTDAGAAVVQVRTREPLRAATTFRKHLIGSDTPYNEWDVVNGFRVFTKENHADHQVKGNKVDFIAGLERPLEDLRSPGSEVRKTPEKIHYYVFVNPHPFIAGNPYAIELIQQYAAILPSTNVCMVFVTNEEPLSDIPSGNLLVADLPTPSAPELEVILDRLIESSLNNNPTFPDGSELTDEDCSRIAHLGLGLTLFEFETYTAISLTDAMLEKQKSITAEWLLKGIGAAKTAVIRQSEILELTPAADIGEVGGMHRLKDWVAARANCFSDDARAFGVEAPKGAAIVGVPGTGKSLVAKAVASVFGVPLVRLDFGRVFSKYVGDSESRVRSALKMVEAMAPCVLFVDEVDKGLGGAGGGGDSGTSSRVLGSFLTWLNDCPAPVFTMLTANRVEGLPPELLRRGRLDQIFSIDMPTAEGRKEVLEIHLRKRHRDIKKFEYAEIQKFVEVSKGYVPAEIESAVKDAITMAFSDATCKDLEMRHILQALKDMVPMSVSNSVQIDRIVEWASTNATSVEYNEASPDPRVAKAEVARPTNRVLRPRR